ncbi:MAG: hypothetical protein C0623_10555 [Desulfuromonas sp.]|nr:MAG: hypothetical protein C0623_10555 [Desulfuromonas sp.]
MSSNDPEKSPWICHVCDYTSTDTEPVACAFCYKVTCATHLAHKTMLNKETGLYELQPICVECQIRPHL